MYARKTLVMTFLLLFGFLSAEALADLQVNVSGLDPGSTVSVTVGGGGLKSKTATATVDEKGNASVTFTYSTDDIPTRETKAEATGTKGGKAASGSTKSWTRSGRHYKASIDVTQM